MSEAGNFNVRTFGAVGDGSTDDTDAIRSAVAEAAKSQATVYIPPGVYLTSTIQLPPHTGLAGNPTWSFRDSGGSILRLIDDSAGCLIDLTGAYGATINGLCIEGADLGEGIHGISIDKPDYGSEEDTPLIERCRVSSFTGDGIHLNRIWCFSVRGNMLMANKSCGLRVRGWDGFILDNWFSGNGGPGYAAYEENASVTMTGNRIEWNGGGGIVLHGGNHYNITGNYIDRSGGAAIALLPRVRKPCEVISISGNVLFRSGAPNWREIGENENAHLRFEHVHGLTCTSNTMRAGRNDGDEGEWSPKYSIVYRALSQSIIKDNVMPRGSLDELMHDLGGHGENVIVKDNIGDLFEDYFWAEWDGC
jgi:hypothetical protein